MTSLRKFLPFVITLTCFALLIAPVAATEEGTVSNTSVDNTPTAKVAVVTGIATLAGTEAGALAATAIAKGCVISTTISQLLALKAEYAIKANLPEWGNAVKVAEEAKEAAKVALGNFNEMCCALQTTSVAIGTTIATIVLVGSVALVVYSVATEDPKIFEGLDQTYSWGFGYP